MSNKSILIVEDDRIISMVLERTLLRNGYDIIGKVDTGEEAIAQCREQEPDLVLMDIQLKHEMDGITAMNRIREFSDVPVIYITGNSDALSRESAKETGYVDYLVKPIQTTALLGILEKTL